MTTEISRSNAAAFLSEHGVPAKSPPIRSSDLGLIMQAPFAYYLSRRLGLVPALKESKALSRGSWFHTRGELFRSPNPQEGMLERWGIREKELKKLCPQIGIGYDGMCNILERERKDLNCAWGWYEAASQLQCINGKTLHDILNETYWEPLAVEPRLYFQYPGSAIPCVSNPDWLLHHNVRKEIWLLDWKTCDASPKVRLESCPVDFQTWHMLFAGHHLLKHIIEQFDLPEDTKFGGVMHVCLQKPTIEFGTKDRDFHIDETPFKSGPRKGQPRNERVYNGEPKLENFIPRCTDWYKGEGEYLDKRPERDANPPVAISTTSAAIWTEDLCLEYETILNFIAGYQQWEPEPANFFRTKAGMTTMSGGLNDYAPFYVAHPTQWPNLIVQQKLIRVERDPDITAETPEGVLQDARNSGPPAVENANPYVRPAASQA